MICFSGDKERSGWDWFDLGLKATIPILILAISSLYSSISSEREREIARQKQESEVVAAFIIHIKSLVFEQKLLSAPQSSPVNGISAALTRTALSQVQDPNKKTELIRFLHDVWELGGKKVLDLSFADLQGADLRGLDLSEAYMFRADLRRVKLIDTKLVGADLTYADLRGTDLSFASLDDTWCRGVKIDASTTWGHNSSSDCRSQATSRAPMHIEAYR